MLSESVPVFISGPSNTVEYPAGMWWLRDLDAAPKETLQSRSYGDVFGSGLAGMLWPELKRGETQEEASAPAACVGSAETHGGSCFSTDANSRSGHGMTVKTAGPESCIGAVT